MVKHYLTITHADGKVFYEGYDQEQETHDRMKTLKDDFTRMGETFLADHVVYVGTSLPFSAMEAEIEFAERHFSMPLLQSEDERDIQWGRLIRYRFSVYLEKYCENEEQVRDEYTRRENLSKNQAKHWIDYRYALAPTPEEAKYIAEGSVSIWSI
jgi:hypothetical protein